MLGLRFWVFVLVTPDYGLGPGSITIDLQAHSVHDFLMDRFLNSLPLGNMNF